MKNLILIFIFSFSTNTFAVVTPPTYRHCFGSAAGHMGYKIELRRTKGPSKVYYYDVKDNFQSYKLLITGREVGFRGVFSYRGSIGINESHGHWLMDLYPETDLTARGVFTFRRKIQLEIVNGGGTGYSETKYDVICEI